MQLLQLHPPNGSCLLQPDSLALQSLLGPAKCCDSTATSRNLQEAQARVCGGMYSGSCSSLGAVALSRRECSSLTRRGARPAPASWDPSYTCPKPT